MRRIRDFLVTTLIGGLVVVLPLAILVLLIRWMIGLVIGLLDPIAHLFPFDVDENVLRLLALLGVLIFLFLVGLVVRTQLGTRAFDWFESAWLTRIPFYSAIKETIQQFTGRNKQPFTKVVLADVFGTGTRMTGFVTDEHDDGSFTIFVPTGPNPTNGFVFHMDPDQVEFLDVPVEDALKSIIGVGVGSSNIISKRMRPPKP